MNYRLEGIDKEKILVLILLSSLMSLIGIFTYYDMLLKILIILLTAAATFLIIIWILKKPDRIVLFLLGYVIFQNFFAIILAKYCGSSISNTFILLKDVIAYLSLFIAMAFNHKKFKLTKPDLFAFVYIIILFSYLLLPNDATLYLKVAQFRQLSTPVVLYLLGRFIILNNDRLIKFLRILIYISIFATLFGFLERYILGDQFWLTIGMPEYMASKGMDKWAYLGGLPGNYYSYDLFSIVGSSVRRVASFIADPTLYGQFLILPISLLLFSTIITGKRRIIFSVLLILGLLLAISKGGVLALGIALAYKTFRSRFRVFGFIAITFLVVIVSVAIQNSHMISSLPAHLGGLTHNIELTFNGYPFGLGLGEAGNITALSTNTLSDNITGAGESYIGMIIGQLGIFILPFILFILTLFNFYRNLLVKESLYRGMIIAMPATLIGTVAASMLSESAISFISAGMLFLLIGCTVRVGLDLNARNLDRRKIV